MAELKIEIREMRLEDIALMAGLEALIFSMPWTENGFRSMLASKDALYLTVWSGERLAGYCGLLQSFDEAEILNVAVHPEYRRQGIGRRMLTELMERGRKRGIRRYTLEVRAGNAGAVKLYEQLGFVCAGIRKNFYEKPREDARIMCYYLRQPQTLAV